MVFNVVSVEFIVVNVEFIVVSAVLRGVSITSMSGVVVGGKNALVTCHINLLPWPTPARVHNAFLLSIGGDSNAHQSRSFWFSEKEGIS